MSDRLQKRGKVYHCWFYDKNGVQIKRSTKCTDRRAAEEVLRQFERAITGAPGAAAHQTTATLESALSNLVNMGCGDLSPATVSMYLQKSGHLVRLLGALPFPPPLTDVQEYINTRKNEGAHLETIRKELVTLRRALILANIEPHGHVPQFKVRYVPRDTYLTLDEFQRLISTLEPLRQMWVILAVFTGGRDSEIDALAWEHIDWGQKTILLPGTKTNKSRRRIPLHPVLAEYLSASRQKSGVIVGEWGNVWRGLQSACARVGIDKHITPNDLRRTFASWLKQKGVDSYHVAQLLGHSTSRMVELVYGKIDQPTLKRAMDQLPGGDKFCTKYVLDSAAPVSSVSPVSRSENVQPAETLVSTVLGGGIEPPTRGFSVRLKPRLKLRSVK